ncbi:MAG: L-lysine 6-transaminase [Chitinophagales bacterium]|nr:L-lysine 6-transaminase [Chitinophagales bacterium]
MNVATTNTQPKDVKTVLGKHILADGYDFIFDFERSHGSFLVDQRDGKEYLDFFSMFGSMAVGYNHPYITAYEEDFVKISFNKTSISDIYNTYYADFVETFGRIGIPSYMPHAFFIDGGALAVENALKVAFDWKVRKNLQRGKGEKGSQVIHFKQAFHGRSGYTLALTNTSDQRKYMYFPKFDWPRIINPKLRFPLTEEHVQATMAVEQQAILEIKQAIAAHPDDIAAIIIEPIQAEGGDNHFRKEFLQALRQICDEQEIMLIFDEVQTGVCLTGKFWAHQNYDVQPDVMSFGKKTQVCGCLAGRRVDEIERNVFVEPSRINSTFGGNMTDMWRFKLILDIIEQEQLAQNAATVGKYLLNKLHNLQEKHADKVSNVRGIGLMCAFDLPSTEERNKFIENARAHQLLILACGDQSIRFRPHLIVSEAEIDMGMDIIERVLG